MEASKMLKRCVVDSIAILLCMCFIAGCGGGNKVVDNVKDVANSKMETAANALGQATSHPKYAQFRALKLNCSYDTACKIMLGKPTFQIGGTCTWASNGDTILCSFENDKLYLKSFDTKKIILKDAFSIDQFNKIQKGDSYDTVKGKLNKQDGYLSAHYITPIGEYEQYSWRNSDETIAEILFVKGNVCDKKIKGLNNGKPPVVNTPEEKAAVDVLYNYCDALSNKQYEKAYNYFTPELQKLAGGYDSFMKNVGAWDLRIVESKIISSNDHSARIQAITESKAILKEGTIIRRLKETLIIQKRSSGWKIADVKSAVIDEKIVKNK